MFSICLKIESKCNFIHIVSIIHFFFFFEQIIPFGASFQIFLVINPIVP
jgi:hypothetical protein